VVYVWSLTEEKEKHTKEAKIKMQGKYDDNIFRARDTHSFSHDILNTLRAKKFAAQWSAQEMTNPIKRDFSASAVAVEILRDTKNGV
jgi:hypothetical protein